MGRHIDGEPEDGSSRARALGVIEDGSLEEFYGTAVQPLLRLLLRRRVPMADAEDLVIEAVIVVGQRWSQLNSPFAYACEVALNGWRSLRVQDDRLRAVYPRLVDPPVAEDEQLSRWEQTERVEQLLGLLSPIQRAVVAGRQEGYSTAELAERLGIPPAAVRRHLHEGHARLRKVLRPPSPAAAGGRARRGGAAGRTRAAGSDQVQARDWVEDGGNDDE